MDEVPPSKVKVPYVSAPDALMSTSTTQAMTSLSTACYAGDTGRVSELIKRDPNLVHEVDDEGRTGLHFAAYQSAANVATLLLRSVLKTDVVEPFKRTLKDLRERTKEFEKSCVSEEDHKLCTQWLKEEKERQCMDFQINCTTVTVNILSRVDSNGCTPLHYAATTRDDTLCELMKFPEKFAEEQLACGELHTLIKSGGPGHGVKEDIITREEREKRADRINRRRTLTTRKLWRSCINIKDTRLNTVLHFAACSGSTSAVRYLTRYGANHTLTNDSNQTPLDVCEDRTCRASLLRLPQAVDEACDRGGELATVDGAIKSLLNHGEHVNATSSIQETTALHRACSRGAYQVVIELLDENGADPLATNANGWTGLHCCGYYSTLEHVKIAKELLDRDVDVDARTLRQRTPLHLVVLQEHCSDNNSASSNESKSDSLDGSSSRRRRRRNNEVDENTRTHCRMPEYKTARTRQSSLAVVNMIELLVRRGADLESVDVSGKTALHFAAKKGDPRVVHSLLLLGAYPYSLTRNKMNALHLAVEHSKRAVVRLLVRHDAEKRLLKGGRDSSSKLPADVAPDQKTRECLISLWEACEDGNLELTRKLLLDNPSKSPTNPMTPWVPVGLADITLTRKLSCLHLVARGAGKCYKAAKKAFDIAKKRDRGAKSNVVQRELDLKMNGYRQIASLLMRRGCKSDREDVNGMTPLMVAAMEGAVGLIGVLATGRATGTKGRSNMGEEEEDELLNLIEAEDKSGNTAMHYAMAFRQISAANALEALGGDVLVENKRGETAMAVAGIGIQLASHLRKGGKKNNNEWRKNVTDDTHDTAREGKREESRPPPTREDAKNVLMNSASEIRHSKRPTARPPSRPSGSTRPTATADVPVTARPPPRGSDNARDILKAAAADEDDKEKTTAANRPSRPSRPTGKSKAATNALVAAATDVNSSSSSSLSASRPSTTPLSSTINVARPPPTRPSGRSKAATSALKKSASEI